MATSWAGAGLDWLNEGSATSAAKEKARMWTLSGFVDEIADDVATQCEVAAGLGLRFTEIRSGWGVNVLDLDDAQLGVLQRTLADHGLGVSSIGSPIGKIFIDEDFEPHLERMRHAAEVANRLDAPYLRLFSFFIRPNEDPDQHRDEVLRRMRALADVAEQAGIVAVHENEKEIYGDIPRRCLEIVTEVDSPSLKLAWDPANFVQVGVRPFDEGYEMLRPHVVYMQIKDAHLANAEVDVAGAGDGQLRETVRALRADGFEGFFSLEPHLDQTSSLGGFSGPQLFTEAHKAFTALLDSEGIEYA
jgi:sugar phosphate isomerase/epimerase